MSVSEQVIDIIGTCLDMPKNEVTEEMKISVDLGFGSLDYIEVLMEIEEHFDIMIPEDENFQTVGDLIKYVENKIQFILGYCPHSSNGRAVVSKTMVVGSIPAGGVQ